MVETKNIDLLPKDVLYSGEKNLLIEFDEGDIAASIYISRITQNLKENIEKGWHFKLNDDQAIIQIVLKYPGEKKIEVESKFSPSIILDTIFTFILSVKDFEISFRDGYGRTKLDTNHGVGVGLPFSILQFTEEGRYINAVYANDFTKIATNIGFYVEINDDMLDRFRKLSNKVMVDKKNLIGDFLKESVTLIHTLNWVVRGFFYPAVIILFSCFDYLTNRPQGERMDICIRKNGFELNKNEKDDLRDFHRTRIAIAHPDQYNIIQEKNMYISYKKEDGTEYTKFNVERLDNIRQLLIDLIVHKLD